MSSSSRALRGAQQQNEESSDRRWTQINADAGIQAPNTTLIGVHRRVSAVSFWSKNRRVCGPDLPLTGPPERGRRGRHPDERRASVATEGSGNECPATSHSKGQIARSPAFGGFARNDVVGIGLRLERPATIMPTGLRAARPVEHCGGEHGGFSHFGRDRRGLAIAGHA